MKQNMENISVIVPIYNVNKYLDKCISSILGQTYNKLQVILVDDGSTDGSGAICNRCAIKDSRIQVIHKENGGLISARRAGIQAATGEYIGFVDGDDWIEPQMYEHLVCDAEKYQADMVVGGYMEDFNGQTIDKTNQIKTGIYDKEKMAKELYPYMLCMRDFSSMGIQPYLWNKLMKRELAYECIEEYDHRIQVGEDVAALMPMLLKSDRVVINDDCDYHYCVRGDSMMHMQKDEEDEWKGLLLLHQSLERTFIKYDVGNIRQKYQLNHYTVGNMLTRAYGKLAESDGKEILYPFGYKICEREYILYGAGNFGRAIYEWFEKHYPEKVRFWVDREYLLYQSIGLPVCGVADVDWEQEMDILVAVLDMRLAVQIKENLAQIGADRERIHCIQITEDEVYKLITGIQKLKSMTVQ